MSAVLEQLRKDGWTVTKLAGVAGTTRSHMSQVLANKPGRGHQTRKKIAPILSVRARALLRWDAAGNLLDGPKTLVVIKKSVEEL